MAPKRIEAHSLDSAYIHRRLLTLVLNNLDGEVFLPESEKLQVTEGSLLCLGLSGVTVDLDTKVVSLVLEVEFTLRVSFGTAEADVRLTSVTLKRFLALTTFLEGIAIKLTRAGWLVASGCQYTIMHSRPLPFFFWSQSLSPIGHHSKS